jgi:predicted NUDIX family NTP pyrophosphohydrolase
MPHVSAGLLMYRICHGKTQVLLVHPGGPFWRKRDDGAWSIPKGEITEAEDLLDAATVNENSKKRRATKRAASSSH